MADDPLSADSAPDDDPFHLDPTYNSDNGTVPPVWAQSDRMRDLIKKARPDSAERDELAQAVVRQLRTALLYEEVLKAITAPTAKDDPALVLYVILFPGQGRDNTGLKDLNDNVLGYILHTDYIRERQQHICDIFKTGFIVVGQDYKTALILAVASKTQDFVVDNRKDFDARLKQLDKDLRTTLIALLKKAEDIAQYKKQAEKLRRILEKDSDYRFDIYYGLSAATPAKLRTA